MQPIELLHLSDLHLGPKTLAFEDPKVQFRLDDRDRLTAASLLWQTLVRCPHKPISAIIVSGDITIQGSKEGFDEFARHMTEVAERLGVPRRRIVVVPGNHDVRWEIATPVDRAERYVDFLRCTAGFTIPWLDGANPGLEATDELEVEDYARHYLLDMEAGLLVYPLNSTVLSGRLAIPAPDVDAIKSDLRRAASGSDGDGAVERVLASLHRHDAAFVGPRQLEVMHNVLGKLEARDGGRYRRLVKIAVLHHHIGHVARAPTEFKSFEMIVDGAQVKHALMHHGFHVVLHGHKHVWQLTRETLGESPGLIVLSSGTVGGYPALNSSTGFNHIRIRTHGSGNRRMEARRCVIEMNSYPDTIWPGTPFPEVNLDQRTFVSSDAEGRNAAGAARAALDDLATLCERLDQPDLLGFVTRLARSACSPPAGIEQAHWLQTLFRNLTTRHLGVFPDYMQRICGLLAGARHSIQIATDFPGYGFFSKPELFSDYLNILRKAVMHGVRIEMVYQSETHRRDLQDRQFGVGPAEWAALKSTSMDLLRAFFAVEGIDPDKIASLPVFNELCIRLENKMIATQLGCVQEQFENAAVMPIVLWVVDDAHGIFGIPSFDRVVREHGFETRDEDLLRSLRSVWDLYRQVSVRAGNYADPAHLVTGPTLLEQVTRDVAAR